MTRTHHRRTIARFTCKVGISYLFLLSFICFWEMLGSNWRAVLPSLATHPQYIIIYYLFPFWIFYYCNTSLGCTILRKTSMFVPIDVAQRRKIRLIENNAKCRYLKSWPVKGFCDRCFICLRPVPSFDPILPPYTLHTCIQYIYSHREGERRRANQREAREAMLHEAGRKYQQDWLYLQSINSIKHQIRRHLGFGVFYSYLIHGGRQPTFHRDLAYIGCTSH